MRAIFSWLISNVPLASGAQQCAPFEFHEAPKRLSQNCTDRGVVRICCPVTRLMAKALSRIVTGD